MQDYGKIQGEWTVQSPEYRDAAIEEMLNELSEAAERVLTLDDVTMESRIGPGILETVTMVVR